jgi:general secretion pathway protein H
MPTSATGSRNATGFTLVELMVVLAIVGLMTTVIAVNLATTEDAVRSEAERFGARLLAARDNAILTNRETAAVVDARGYNFVERDGKGWRPLDEAPLVATRWRDGTTATASRVAFDSVGLAEPVSVVLASSDSRATVAVSASGEVRVDAR